MIDHLWQMIDQALQSNQFLSGGAVLMVLAALGAWLRHLPGRLWRWFYSWLLIEVDIPDRDDAFRWLNDWLAVHPYSQHRARLLTVRTEKLNDRPQTANETPRHKTRPSIIFSPAPGYHWFFYRRRLVMLHRDRKEGSNGMVSLQECFRLRVFTTKRRIITQLLEEARELAVPSEDNRITILTVKYGDWSTDIKRPPRPIESVILQDGVMERLLADVETFLDREQWYANLGIPYRRGYLLYGPPGSGKSSTVAAIASHFGMDIALLNLSAASLDDDELRNLLSDVPPRTFVLIEDVDGAFSDRKKTNDKKGRVTFSGLLNAIDGVAAGEGRIIFLTTNHIDRLDPALVRPGRCDVKEEIGAPNNAQIAKLFQRFFPQATASQASEFVRQTAVLRDLSMAWLQGHLMQATDVESAIESLPLNRISD
jgi:chaperone BCS1